MSDLGAILAQAYQEHQVNHQPGVASRVVRDFITDGAQRAAAEIKHQELGAIVAARTMSGVCGCHVSKIQHEILSAALQESLNG